MLLPSEAAEVAVEVANSSNAEISMRGRLVSPEEAATLAPEPFAVGKAPEGTARVGGKIGLLRKWYLEKPLAMEEVIVEKNDDRSGHGCSLVDASRFVQCRESKRHNRCRCGRRRKERGGSEGGSYGERQAQR